MAQVGSIPGSSPHQESSTSSPSSTTAINAPIPLSFNLTPASDSFGGRYLSSTRASVDSDSDYQAVINSNNANTNANINTNALSSNRENTSATPSRPVSRSSTFSGLSTTATKDGVEGKRVHRIHDPLGYATWLFPTSTTATPTTTTTAPPPVDKRINRLSIGSSVSSTISNSKHHQLANNYNRSDDMDDGDDEADSDLIDYDTENASPRILTNDYDEDEDDEDEEDADNMAASIERRTRRDNYISSTNSSSIMEIDQTNTNNENNELYNDNSNEGDDEADDNEDQDESIHPPNIPSAPPVTLNEKIRLLRTGSVSGVSHPHHHHSDDGTSEPIPHLLPNGQLRQDFYSDTDKFDDSGSNKSRS